MPNNSKEWEKIDVEITELLWVLKTLPPSVNSIIQSKVGRIIELLSDNYHNHLESINTSAEDISLHIQALQFDRDATKQERDILLERLSNLE